MGHGGDHSQENGDMDTGHDRVSALRGKVFESFFWG